MSDGLLFVLVTLAAYRLWRFVSLDDFPPMVAVRDWFRDAVFRRYGDEWAGGIACAWCAGFWCTIAVVAAVWAWRPLPAPALWFAAISTVVGLVAMTVED